MVNEFTTTNYGGEVVKNGTIITLLGIANYPYTILFNLDDTSVLVQENNELMVGEKGVLGGFVLVSQSL